MVLLITYEIKNKFRDLSNLYSDIKSADVWWHHIGNVWIIETPHGPQYWYNKIAHNFTSDDYLLITRLSGNFYAWLPQEAIEWLKSVNY